MAILAILECSMWISGKKEVCGLTSNDPSPAYKILIVDDEKDVLVALHTTLKRARQFTSDVSIAENGSEALAELEKKEFDIVLSDYKMPKMDGLELLERVREKYPSIVRILITACSDIALVKDAINRLAVDYYIEKPWDRKELISLIHEALKRKKPSMPRKDRKSEFSDQALPVGLLPIISDRDSDDR